MADEDEIDEELAALDEADPISGARVKSPLARSFEVYFGELQARSEGLSGAELQSEIDRFMNRLVERHVASVPAGLRGELRGRLKAMLQNDPTLSGVLGAFRRAAAQRERR